MIKIYHNPRCKKSRAGLSYLETKGVEFEVVEYIKNPMTEDDLKNILIKMNAKPLEIVREQEELFRKQFKNKNFTDEEWIKIMVENPKLIKRPVVEKDYKAIWADPPEEIEKIFE